MLLKCKDSTHDIANDLFSFWELYSFPKRDLPDPKVISKSGTSNPCT